MTKKPEFTTQQIDWICWQIGDWYYEWKYKLIDWETKQHKLGYAKEMLKDKICGTFGIAINTPKMIGELPDGYEYKLLIQPGFIKIIGVAVDKEPIGFYIDADYNLNKMDV